MILAKALKLSLAATVLLLLMGGVQAADSEAEKEERVRQGLALLLPDLVPDAVSPSPVPGLYEVVVGPQIIYITEDARFILRGDVIDLELRKNITQPRVDQVKAQAVERIGEENMLIYAPDETRHTVTVFTDIDCGFCRKMHKEMAEYHKHGIRIRYLLFPRAGVNSPSYRKAVSVWCSKDPRAAMTQAKLGKFLDDYVCDNPVAEHMALGEAMGVTGTPALVFDNGEMIPGYIPPERMAQLLSARAGE